MSLSQNTAFFRFHGELEDFPEQPAVSFDQDAGFKVKWKYQLDFSSGRGAAVARLQDTPVIGGETGFKTIGRGQSFHHIEKMAFFYGIQNN